MPAEISLFHLLLANLVVLLGSCLQGVAGYGIGTLAAPLLFLISPLFIPGPLTLNAAVLSVLMLVRNRTSIRFREVRFAIGGGLAGTVLAGLTLLVISPTGFELAFGALILVAVVLSVAGLKPRLNARNSVIAGAASSYMGTITAVGGPPIAMVYQNEKGPVARANLSAFFLFTNAFVIATLFFSGYLGVRELWLAAALMPGVFIGFWLSAHLVNRLPFAAMRPIILSIAAAAGLAALVRGLLSLWG